MYYHLGKGHRGRDRMVMGVQLSMQSVLYEQ